jgi:hypothetical protein
VTVYDNLESKGGVKTSAILDMNAKEVGALSGAHRLGEKVSSNLIYIYILHN